MHTELRDDEEVIRDGRANLQRGIETVGGYLYLTTRRLIFEAHAFNVQSGRTVIPLRDIEDASPCWTKLFGLVPIFPNSLAVFTTKGKTFRFVIGDRDGWRIAIREARQDWEDQEGEE
jgi:hypothetical protein